MNVSQRVEWQAMTHQEGMNAVIDRFDSPVQRFYRGTTAFVTGSSGFLGKQLVEKVLRSCQIKKIYLLLRSKKGKTIQERLDYVLTDPLYDVLREHQPNFADKIVPVEGDVADIRLGLSNKDWTMLTEEVDTVFHMAATVRFDEPLRKATLTNIRGTRETLTLARECANLKNYIYVSTAFSHATDERVGQPVLEQFYPSPIMPETLIGLAESLDEERLDDITESLIKGWPNTYTFTKAVAEEAVRTYGGDMPVCVVRPPIVVPTYYEPKPGWMDLSTISGPTGILSGIILGILHVFYVNKDSKLSLTPVDYVNNATIAAGWDAAQRRQDGETKIPVYTVSNKEYFITWNFIKVTLRNEGLQLASPKAVWYCYMIEVQNKLSYWVLSFFLHYIPAYILDVVGAISGKMPNNMRSFVAVFRKIDKFTLIYHYFLSNEWGFQDDNIQAMVSRMSEADKAIYNCDMKTIDFAEYVKVWGVGIRKYIIKDGLKDSEQAFKKQIIFKAANFVLIAFYVFVVFSILAKCWSIVCCLL